MAVKELQELLTRADDDNNNEQWKTWLIILTAVFGVISLTLLACVIALFVLVSKLSSKLKKLKEEKKDAFGIHDYKISRPRMINSGNNYQRFMLPSKLENDTNSDVFFGSSSVSPNNNPGPSRNPLSQAPELNRQKSFNYEEEREPVSKNRPSAIPSHLHYQNPTSDYFNVSDRSKFTY